MQTRLFPYDPEEIKKLGLIEHHVRYRELHIEDSTVWLTRSEHNKLHRRLRKRGKCKIPPDELKIISKKANRRTKKTRKYQRDYFKNNISNFSSLWTIGSGITLSEKIIFNKKTGNIYLTSFFRTTTNKKLKIWSE